MQSPPSTSATELAPRLTQVMGRDARRLQRRLDGTRRIRDPRKRADAITKIAAEVARAEQRFERRAAARPDITYPAELPVSQAHDELRDAISASQVVVVAGETGSGKTTQLPKLCLELGRGIRGTIGHTQPRRLAARTVAARIAEELDVELGRQVGFQVRFDGQVSDVTLVKLMTDGVLLAEMQHDRDLLAYDTLIVDEAHERSLNIDFLLGYLRRLLPRRPDLKLIITSATIDPQRFSRHFDNAPIVEVSGRTYPVEVRYRSLEEPDDEGQERDQIQGICDAVEELSAEAPGDVLVFLSGEREIRDTAEALEALRLRDTEVLPLYARLSAAEQHRAFQPHRGRRIVLATNVAETSVTVPGVRYVVDPGTARISRYSHRTKVQRLPIEAVSQASANQRKGRCGRVAEGVCIRLYSQEDFEARPEFTDPEILRTNLASVILQMTALDLGDVADFPFVDAPDARSIRDAIGLLEELGAIVPDVDRPRLTEIGLALAKLPVDPRLGRMIVEANRSTCLREVLVITAALSIQDPRERPSDRQQAADELHGRFAADDSDFLAYLNLWDYVRELQRGLSGNQFRRRCKAEFLHYLRIREWQDLYAQLLGVAQQLGMALNDAPADPQFVHQALLSGLLSHVGLKDPAKREYLGARNGRFSLWPGSALAKQPPRWVMAAELVETSRLFARTAARVEPEWVERLALHLVKRSYSEPRWASRRGAAVATERVTLYGIPLVTGRTVAYGRIDPPVSRELFLRHALLGGDSRTPHAFLAQNREVLEQLRALEHRARRHDIGVDEETLYAFYDARIPDDVVSTRHFDAWWKRAKGTQPELLTMTPQALAGAGAEVPAADDYPDVWVQGDLRLGLTYRYEPGAEDDGVSVHIPLGVLNRVSPGGFEWLVPGLREELVTALVRSLPKDLRRPLIPIPETVRAVLPRLQPGRTTLSEGLSRALQEVAGVVIPPAQLRLDRVPDYLRMTFNVLDGAKVVTAGKDLPALQRDLVGAVRVAVTSAAGDIERRGERRWAFGSIPRTIERRHGEHAVFGYPALVDEGATVGLRVFLSEREQSGAMWQGTRRLLLLQLPAPVRTVHGRLSNAAKLALTWNPHGSVAALLEDCAACAVDVLMTRTGAPAWDTEAFTRVHRHVAAGLEAELLAVVDVVQRILAVAADVSATLERTAPALPEAAVEDMRTQYAHLIYPGFVTGTGRVRLPHLDRYLRAIERRLARLPADPGRDLALATTVAEVQLEYDGARRRRPPMTDTAPLRDIRWMIEELRVSLFAQQLGTAGPISEQRIYRAIAALGY